MGTRARTRITEPYMTVHDGALMATAGEGALALPGAARARAAAAAARKQVGRLALRTLVERQGSGRARKTHSWPAADARRRRQKWPT